MEYVLKLACPDRTGIVAAVAGWLAGQGCNIETSDQFGDPGTGRFFMRVRFSAPEGARGLREGFAAVAAPFSMDWDIRPLDHVPRLLVMVSRFGHCLTDLLHRVETGWLKADIVAIQSNHADFGPLAAYHGIPFHHVPATDRAAAEAHLTGLMVESGAELVVLARYMQILSPELCARLAGACVNIHHSFLPGFKGARPYHQAHALGVKLIGATAHYVTADLDGGPIIEQAVERVDHRAGPEDLAQVGRDLECLTLARALKYHCEGRVFLNGPRTVVFR